MSETIREVLAWHVIREWLTSSVTIVAPLLAVFERTRTSDWSPPRVLLTASLVMAGLSMTVLWGLRPAGTGRWDGGWFYNPDDGKTYNVTAELRSNDEIAARIYKVLPLLGTTKNLSRVPRLSSEGWC